MSVEPADAATWWTRLGRRKLVQWALAYGAGAWVLLQVLGFIASAYDWQPAVVRIATSLVLAGFPVALVLAWYHGERGEQKVSGGELLILAALLALGGGMLWWAEHEERPGIQAVAGQGSGASATPSPPRAESAALPHTKSIAVLAFADLSPARDQEYFSDGIAEEILNALAKVQDLKVAGRTASFYFKGRSETLQTIGQTLGVAHVLEGSVRKQGDRVRITAQLIQASDGFHLWSDTFDGELTNVFELQERIARAITDELKAVLQAGQRDRLVPVATNNADAYALYLRAGDALNRRDYPRMGEAIGWLEEALRLDPRFARAHARLALIHSVGQERYGASKDAAERHAQRALELDPELADAHVAQALAARGQGHLLRTRRSLERALELAPEDATVNFTLAQALVNNGYVKSGVERLDRALTLDPMLPNAVYWRGQQHAFAGEFELAERAFERARYLGLSYADLGFAEIARERGEHARARALLREPLILRAPCLAQPETSIDVFLDGAIGGDDAARARAQAVVEECLASGLPLVPLWAIDFLMRNGQSERALQFILDGRIDNVAGVRLVLWNRGGSATRRSPEFPEFARKLGFAELWDAYGPPDACRRVAPLDYRCD